MLFSGGLVPRWCNKKVPADARFARMSFLSTSWCLPHAFLWKGQTGGIKSSSFFLEKKDDGTQSHLLGTQCSCVLFPHFVMLQYTSLEDAGMLFWSYTPCMRSLHVFLKTKCIIGRSRLFIFLFYCWNSWTDVNYNLYVRSFILGRTGPIKPHSAWSINRTLSIVWKAASYNKSVHAIKYKVL